MLENIFATFFVVLLSAVGLHLGYIIGYNSAIRDFFSKFEIDAPEEPSEEAKD